MPHFFFSDLLSLAIAFVLGIPAIVLPGYGLGWMCDVLGFREKNSWGRWSVALLCGLTMEPVLLYAPFRLISANAMWIVWGVLLACGIYALTRVDRILHWSGVPRPAKFAIVLWLPICALLMLDFAVGNRVYPSTAIIDTSFRSQVISSVAQANHLPVPSPFFHPGRSVPLHYHYMFFLLGGLIVRLGAGLVTSGMTVVALSGWSGLAMFSIVSLFLEHFYESERPVKVKRVAWILLGVGGLGILPVGAEMLTRWITGLPEHVVAYGYLEQWNGWGAAFSWLDTAIWSAHHLVGLAACVLGCLLLWSGREERGARRWIAAIAAGLAFATAAGTSVYVTAIFAIFLVIVTIEMFLNAPRYLAPLLVAGVAATVLGSPFLMDMHQVTKSGGESMFAIAARPFQPVILLYEFLGIKSPLAWNLTYLATLPINYLLELGLFFIAGAWWIWDRRGLDGEGGSKVKVHLMIGLTAISLILPGVIWSGMEYSNDFGYRGLLPAQFILLVFAADLLSRYDLRSTTDRTRRRVLQVALCACVLGVGSNVLNAFLLRTTLGLFDKGTFFRGQMIRVDHSAERLGDLRAAYEWIRKNTARSSVVQENPITWQMIAQGQYSQRAAAVYGSNPSFMVGEDHKEYLADVVRARRLFAADVTDSEADSICSDLQIDYVVVQKGDPGFSSERLARSKVLFERGDVRVIPCRPQNSSNDLP